MRTQCLSEELWSDCFAPSKSNCQNTKTPNFSKTSSVHRRCRLNFLVIHSKRCTVLLWFVCVSINYKNWPDCVLGLAWTLEQSRELSKNGELWELYYPAHELQLENGNELPLQNLLAVSWCLEPGVQKGLGMWVRVCVSVIVLILKNYPKVHGFFEIWEVKNWKFAKMGAANNPTF